MKTNHHRQYHWSTPILAALLTFGIGLSILLNVLALREKTRAAAHEVRK